MHCGQWPLHSGYVCDNVGGDVKSLDRKMNVSDYENCANLCKQEGTRGCCSLSDESGCSWKGFSTAVYVDDSNKNQLAVACYEGI